MEEVMCYLLPASICTLIVSKQVKKISNQNLVLVYLISTLLIYLIENVVFIILRGKESYKFFNVYFSTKYVLLAILLSFMLGIIFSFIYKRFSLESEVKNEKNKRIKEIKRIKKG